MLYLIVQYTKLTNSLVKPFEIVLPNIPQKLGSQKFLEKIVIVLLQVKIQKKSTFQDQKNYQKIWTFQNAEKSHYIPICQNFPKNQIPPRHMKNTQLDMEIPLSQRIKSNIMHQDILKKMPENQEAEKPTPSCPCQAKKMNNEKSHLELANSDK